MRRVQILSPKMSGFGALNYADLVLKVCGFGASKCAGGASK